MSSPYVLIVDDETEIAEGVAELLRSDSFEVRMASNGNDAFETIRSCGPPCLILLDLMMPVMNGWEFAEQAARNPATSKIPIVLMTASTARPPAQTTVKFILRKPLQLEDLVAITVEYCRTKP